ncbi:MAG: hypothetical protein WC054_01165 [Candidatus Nanopelagicales bacterium]
MTNIALAHVARGIAIGAHAGQRDKAGQLYITHPARVAAQFPHDVVLQSLAWVHDVVEDTSVTLDDLAWAGFPESMVLQVDALTHRDREPRTDYYDRILQSGAQAVAVKLADVADNSRPDRLSYLDEETRNRLIKKYLKAYDYLKAGAL